MRFKSVRRRFDCRLGATVALIGDTPCLMRVSYLIAPLPHEHPGCWLHPEANQDLIAALYLHKQHTV
jgi:hypothetical protein